MASVLRAVARTLLWTVGILVGAIVLILLMLTGSFWFYSSWFWGACLLATIVATLIYVRRYPPQVTEGDSAVPVVRVAALRCAVNALVVAVLWQQVLASHAHENDLPLWLLAETVVFIILAFSWMTASADIETTLLTASGRAALKETWSWSWKDLSETAILPVVQGVFWLCAGSAFAALLLLMSPFRWLPGWGAFLAGWLGGAVFGFVMADAFVRLPPIKPLFETVPINGATGARLSIEEVFAPYTIVAVLGGILLPTLNEGRHRRGLLPLEIPHSLVWVPVVLALLMAVACLWGHLTRDPAEAERERAEAEADYREAVTHNGKLRVELIACAELILTAWEGREGEASAWMPENIIEQVQGKIGGSGIFSPLPDSEALWRAQDFLIQILGAATAGASQVEGIRPRGFLSRKKATMLSWEEAMALTADVAGRLREERPMDHAGLLHFLGQRSS